MMTFQCLIKGVVWKPKLKDNFVFGETMYVNNVVLPEQGYKKT